MEKSENITELVKALIGMQPQLLPAIKDKTNPFFKSKYADLAGVVESSRQLLSAHKLAISQVSSIDATGPYLETILMHESGQWISGKYPLKPIKDDPQAMGSAMTYARRYTWAAILGIVTEDDDAEGAMERQDDHKKQDQKQPSQSGQGKAPQTSQNKEPVQGSNEWILNKMKEYGFVEAGMLQYLNQTLHLPIEATVKDTLEVLTKKNQIKDSDRAAIAKAMNAKAKEASNGQSK